MNILLKLVKKSCSNLGANPSTTKTATTNTKDQILKRTESMEPSRSLIRGASNGDLQMQALRQRGGNGDLQMQALRQRDGAI
jgi:hypothetical protein